MNQSKLKVVKQETENVNIDILGTSELKWTAMGDSNSDNHYFYFRVLGSGRAGTGVNAWWIQISAWDDENILEVNSDDDYITL